MTVPVSMSICIPTYNGEEFIAAAIESVLTQNFSDFELLVVDDGSNDATVDIALSFRDSRIQVHRNARCLGIPGNWNRCLSLARGEYVCVFHQDDVMLPQNLARKAEVLAADATISFVHSAAELVVEETAPTTSADWMEKAAEDFIADGHSYFRKLLFHGNVICAPTVLARRRQMLDLGGFDEDLGFACDYEMWMKLCVNNRVAFLHQSLVHYRWHARNASHAYRFERGVRELETASNRALQYYLEKTKRHEEGAVLSEAVTALAQLRRWEAELAQGKAWLEEQRANWQQIAGEQARVIQEQKHWIGELEKGKAWLEEQRANWQRIAEEREGMVREQLTRLKELAKTIREQQAWIQVLEKSKLWLEEQWRSWQESAWGRLGVRLGVLKPSDLKVPEPTRCGLPPDNEETER